MDEASLLLDSVSASLLVWQPKISIYFYFAFGIICRQEGRLPDMNTIEKVQEIFAKKVKVEKLDPNIELRELGLDSLDLVELMMDIEEEFKIEFDNDEMVSFKTLTDVVKAIDAKVKK